jgi:glycosyltransferase involved in cell wall biosynthesis
VFLVVYVGVDVVEKRTEFNLLRFRESPLPSEAEIISRWKGDLAKPVVSVICNTYNQKQYIEDAIRGFLIQKTDFPFEVIINDDASFDGAREVIQKYVRAYPKIIRPIFQATNQFSQGKKPTLLSMGYANGDYIALCEGDDFWISQDKLKVQLDFILKNNNLNIVFHSAMMLLDNGEFLSFCNHGVDEMVADVGSIIERGGPFMPTASLFFKTSFFNNVVSQNSQFFNFFSSGYFIQVFLSAPEGAGYLPTPMSVYRVQTEGSWSESIKTNPERFIAWVSTFVAASIQANKIFKGTYSREFKKAVRKKLLSLANNEDIEVSKRKSVLLSQCEFLKYRDFVLWYLILSRGGIHRVVKSVWKKFR